MKKLLLLAICAGLLAACGGQAPSEASSPEGNNANLLNLYKAIGSGWQEEGTQPEAAEAAAK